MKTSVADQSGQAAAIFAKTFARSVLRSKGAPGQAAALRCGGRWVHRLPCGARGRGRVAELTSLAALATFRQLQRVRGRCALRARPQTLRSSAPHRRAAACPGAPLQELWGCPSKSNADASRQAVPGTRRMPLYSSGIVRKRESAPPLGSVRRESCACQSFWPAQHVAPSVLRGNMRRIDRGKWPIGPGHGPAAWANQRLTPSSGHTTLGVIFTLLSNRWLRSSSQTVPKPRSANW